MDLRILTKLITSNILPYSHLFDSFSFEIVKISIFELHFDVFRYDFQINISTMQTKIKDPDDSFVYSLFGQFQYQSNKFVFQNKLRFFCPKNQKVWSILSYFHSYHKPISDYIQPNWPNFKSFLKVNYQVSQQVLDEKISNLREIRSLKFFRSKKFVKLKWDLQI